MPVSSQSVVLNKGHDMKFLSFKVHFISICNAQWTGLTHHKLILVLCCLYFNFLFGHTQKSLGIILDSISEMSPCCFQDNIHSARNWYCLQARQEPCHPALYYPVLFLSLYISLLKRCVFLGFGHLTCCISILFWSILWHQL